MRHGPGDWLEVVYGAGLDVNWAGGQPARAEIRVRAAPGLDGLAPHEVHRIRVTVAPSDPALSWRLFLGDLSMTPGDPRAIQVWWRAYPGTWQPLGGMRRCVAEGRGRVRVDVSVRIEPAEGSPPPHLRFVAESA